MTQLTHFFKDAGVLAVSIGLAFLVAGSGAVETLLNATESARIFGSFLAGLFFTSIFTTAPAIVTLGEIAQSGSLWLTAALGAVGAVIGDLLIFLLVRDKLSAHLMEHLKDSEGWSRFMVLIRTRTFRWVSFFLGGLIIASPFPDEIGISLLGFSKMETRWFIPLSFVFNFAGIVAIGMVARSLS